MPVPPMPPAPPMDGPPMPKGPPMDAGAPKPPAGGPPSPDEIRAQIGEMLPDPKSGGYSYKTACMLAEKTNRAIEAISKAAGKPAPMEAPEPQKPEKGDLMEGRFPVDVIAPAIIVADVAVGLGQKRYEVDVAGLVNDSAIMVLAGKMDQLAKDKKIRDAIKDGMKAADEEEVADDVVEEGAEKKPGAEAYV